MEKRIKAKALGPRARRGYIGGDFGRSGLCARRAASCRLREMYHGCSEEEEVQFEARHGSFASCAEVERPCRMQQLRRTEAPASRLQRLRSLRWPRSGCEIGCRLSSPSANPDRLGATV